MVRFGVPVQGGGHVSYPSRTLVALDATRFEHGFDRALARASFHLKLRLAYVATALMLSRSRALARRNGADGVYYGPRHRIALGSSSPDVSAVRHIRKRWDSLRRSAQYNQSALRHL